MIGEHAETLCPERLVVTWIANGKVVEDNWVYDALGMMRQLGAVPSIAAKAA